MESICFIHCLDMGPYEILEMFSKIFMLTICAEIEGLKLFFITSFMIYTKRVRLLANKGCDWSKIFQLNLCKIAIFHSNGA